MTRFFRHVPLFAVLWIIYNLVILAGQGDGLQQALFGVGLPSGARWAVSGADILLIAGVLALYVEIFKATRTGASSLLDHSLSVIVFILFVVEFLTVPGAGTSTFLILAVMSLIDVVAGFTVTIVSARRDVAFSSHAEGQ